MSLHNELHVGGTENRLNWLRAAVLGANDGIVSTASVLVGVAGASNSFSLILTAGVAALTAGALSMAVGEYVSVSTQRDTEKALLDKERSELETVPDAELAELATLYMAKGLSSATARTVAEELTAHDAFAAHAEAELGIDPTQLASPWKAALASAAAFLFGALIPLIAILLPPAPLRVPVTFIAVVAALIITGTLSAQAGGARKATAIVRVVLGGVFAMAVTFGIGKLFGVVGL